MDPSDSLLARLRQRLAEDPRTNLLDPDLEVRHGVLHVEGEVESEAAMTAVEQVVAELLPEGMEFVSRLWIVSYTAPSGAENLA